MRRFERLLFPVWLLLSLISHAGSSWAQVRQPAVSAIIVDRNAIGALLAAGSAGWKTIVGELTARRVLVCINALGQKCELVPEAVQPVQETFIRDVLARKRPKNDTESHLLLEDLPDVFDQGYTALVNFWRNLNKSLPNDGDRTIRFTLIAREIHFDNVKGDTLIDVVPPAGCLHKPGETGRLHVATPPAEALTEFQVWLEDPHQAALSEEAMRILAGIAGNARGPGHPPSGGFISLGQSALSCPHVVKATALDPIELKPDSGECRFAPPASVPRMEACPPGPSQYTGGDIAPAKLRPSAAPAAPAAKDTAPQSPAAPQRQGPSNGAPPAAPSLAMHDLPPIIPAPTPAPAVPAAPVVNGEAPRSPIGPAPSRPPAQLPAPTVAPPSAVVPQPSPPAGAGLAPPAKGTAASSGWIALLPADPPPGRTLVVWEGQGMFLGGTVRLEVAVPGAPDVYRPGQALDRNAAHAGHYDVRLTVESKVADCSEAELRGHAVMPGAPARWVRAETALTLLICPNDAPLSIPLGGFDLP